MKKKNWIPFWALCVLIPLAIGTVALRLAVVRLSYAIDQTERGIREAQQARDQAELKVAALRSPRRLELLARTRFGLSQPYSTQIVHMGGQTGMK